MVEAKKIAGLLRQVYGGEPWHGPSLKEILSGVTFEMAYSKPAAGTHMISVVVDHIAFWIEVVVKRLDGKQIEPRPEEDWVVPTLKTKESWEKTLKRLDTAMEELAGRIDKLSLYQLESVVAGKDYDTYFMLHGLIDHVVYHSGQIAILKKYFIRQK